MCRTELVRIAPCITQHPETFDFCPPYPKFGSISADKEHKRPDPDEELVDSYNRAFEKILELPGMTNLEDVVTNYIAGDTRGC